MVGIEDLFSIKSLTPTITLTCLDIKSLFTLFVNINNISKLVFEIMGTWYSPFNLNKVFSDKLESYGYKKIKNNNLVKSDTLIFYTTPDRIIIDLDFDIPDDDISDLILKGYEEVKRFNNKYIFSEFHFSQLDLNQLDDYFKNGVSFFKKSITSFFIIFEYP